MRNEGMSQVTHILGRAQRGDPKAAQELLPLAPPNTRLKMLTEINHPW
jgi:hypothetical protein